MFLDSGFDPTIDLKRNTDGVVEFSMTKPDLERAFDRYVRRAGKMSTPWEHSCSSRLLLSP
jgi:hypothetical protein